MGTLGIWLDEKKHPGTSLQKSSLPVNLFELFLVIKQKDSSILGNNTTQSTTSAPCKMNQ
jgi:hypothetical protein